MKTRTRWITILLFVACQVIAISLLFPTPVYADDCLSDPLNAADCMRTPGMRPLASVLISMAGAAAATLVSIVGSLASTAATGASTATTIYGSGTPDDPYRDASAFKVRPDGKIERYPEMEGKPLNIYGSGTPDDPYRDYPDSGQTTTEVAEPDGVGESQPPPTETQPPQPAGPQKPQTTVSQPVRPVQTPPVAPQTPPPAATQPPQTTGSQPVQTPETPLPPSPVGQAPLPPEPATPQTPQTPTSKTDEKGGPASQKEDSGGEDKGKGEEGEGGKENKGPLDAAKEAAEKYGKNLEDLSGKLEKIKEHLENDPNFSPEAKEKLTKYIDSLTGPLGKVKDKAEELSKGIGKITDFRDQITDLTKGLDKNIQEISTAHQKALEDLKDLPPDAANAAADLSAALDGFGRGADAALNKIPGYKAVGGDKTFEVTKSFQEAGKGLQKAIKTIKTSETAAKDLSKNGDSVPGYTPKYDYNNDPEVIRIRTEAAKNRPQSTWDLWKEKILGKTPSEEVKKFR